VIAGEKEDRRGARRGDGRARRLVGEERHLAEDVAGAQAGEDEVAAAAGLALRDLDLARQHDEEALAGVALPDDDGAGRDLVAVEAADEVELLLVVEGAEEGRRREEVLEQALARELVERDGERRDLGREGGQAFA